MQPFLPVLLAATLWSSAALAEPPKVVATLKPIHALTAAVMGGLSSPDLIVEGGASPHTYSLRPSDASALQQADVVFWTGAGMEVFLADSLVSLAPNAIIVELARSPGIELLPLREGGAFEAHDHAAEDHEHAHGEHAAPAKHDGRQAEEMDLHVWLDPDNAIHMVMQIAATLQQTDPANAVTYAANAAAAIDGLTALTAEVEAQLAPVRHVPFFVFHDAYHYFERRFGLNAAGAITVTPDTMPGAARIAEIRARLAETDVACVFAEPQFEPAIVATLVEGTGARTGTLDPEGAGLEPGPALYGELVRALASALADCLSDH